MFHPKSESVLKNIYTLKTQESATDEWRVACAVAAGEEPNKTDANPQP